MKKKIRTFRKYFLMVMALFVIIPCIRAAYSSVDDSIIIEKNLFRPDRKRWIKEEQEPEVKPQPPKKDDRNLNAIVLYGTVITESLRRAVISTQPGRGSLQTDIYYVGDYAGGYLVKDIEHKRIVLLDEKSGEEYIIFSNEGKKSRTAARTEIRVRAHEPISVSAKDDASAPPPPPKAMSVDLLERRIKRSLRILERRDSDVVRKQVERDVERLEMFDSHLSGEARERVEQLKKLAREKLD